MPVELEPNPIRQLRKLHHMGLDDLSEKSGIHYQTLYLNECGVFPGVLPKLRTFLVKNCDISPRELDAQYKKFVLDKRRVFALQYADKLESLPEPDLTYHPFIGFRQYLSDVFYSKSHFVKSICVEPANVYRLEKRAGLPKMPRRLRDALLQVGLSHENVVELDERINEFYTRSQ